MERGGQRLGAGVEPKGLLGRPGVYQRLTYGERWGNVGVTLGNFPSHLGSILADFEGFAGEK